MGEELIDYNKLAEIINRPNSYVLISLSDTDGIQVKCNIDGRLSKKVVATLMANKEALIETIKAAVIKDLLSKGKGDYMTECVNELKRISDVPYVTPMACGR